VDRLANTVTIDDFTKFMEEQKGRGKRLVKSLNNILPNIEVNFNTTIGNEILKDDLDRYDILLTKLIQEEATDEDRAEIRYLKRRFAILNARVDIAMDALRKMRGTDGR
jgi:hypothetical protein